MKKNLFRLLSSTMTFMLIAFLLINCANVVERKDSVKKYNDFLTEANDFDVLFMITVKMKHIISGMMIMQTM